jgi:hypothetical protein
MLNSLHTDAAFHPVRSFSIALREGLLAWGSGHHVYARTGIRNLKIGPESRANRKLRQGATGQKSASRRSLPEARFSVLIRSRTDNFWRPVTQVIGALRYLFFTSKHP